MATRRKTVEKTEKEMIGTVNTKKGLNVRKGASMENEIASVLKDGEKVTIIGEDGSWWKIPTGYVMKKFITIADE